MQPHDLSKLLEDAGLLDFRQIGSFNKGSVGVFRTDAGISPWELHPDDDEALYVLDGAVTITVLAPAGRESHRVPKGSLFLVPRGCWHRHEVDDFLVELYITPGDTQHSTADDPRS